MSRIMSPYARLFWSVVFTILVLIAAMMPDAERSAFTIVFMGFALFGLWIAGRAAVKQIERDLARKYGHRPYDWEKDGL